MCAGQTARRPPADAASPRSGPLAGMQLRARDARLRRPIHQPWDYGLAAAGLDRSQGRGVHGTRVRRTGSGSTQAHSLLLKNIDSDDTRSTAASPPPAPSSFRGSTRADLVDRASSVSPVDRRPAVRAAGRAGRSRASVHAVADAATTPDNVAGGAQIAKVPAQSRVQCRPRFVALPRVSLHRSRGPEPPLRLPLDGVFHVKQGSRCDNSVPSWPFPGRQVLDTRP